ncbi:hypothetical protein RV11_GL003075 [Enterococcus phoeniculicola]|jgi:hypothetical protein|uniref:Uncharacterized protein n=1 Tax=Enterococcus phoeniculicola ATCC BAA-412 TaxID=1158610 RepID=R3W698_9ENTE|nr:hypothetical protein [Enterococcus phoeniculicola]EOL43107.1 hypothetical protein UC3_02084 [Enterococcus phoeniculicola ATCC BAA-412]EOT76535.1 hypothetical protein I589_01492 [Enterococcus phoeniculicola ATCC BAA-412]OJG72104.1 hypothetical protein RV11_GL003075 [Enterococcus phoeniculicola]
MDVEQTLDQLSEEITRTFHKDFIFLISPTLVQHFPARGWSNKQIEDELKKRLGDSLIFDTWHDHTIVYQKNDSRLALIP